MINVMIFFKNLENNQFLQEKQLKRKVEFQG